MGVFDRGVDPAIFEEFKSEVNQQISYLKKEISIKITDSEEAVRACVDRALALEKKIIGVDERVANALILLEGYSNQGKVYLAGLEEVAISVEGNSKLVNKVLASAQVALDGVLLLKQNAEAASAEIDASFAILKAASVESAKLPADILKAKELLEQSGAIAVDMVSLKDHSLKKKSEIDELHRKVIGADIKSTEGVVEHVDGLVDELDTAYADLESKISSLQEDVGLVITQVTEDHTQKLAQDRQAFEDVVAESREKYKTVHENLLGLLPGAMAAGLSAAYEDKKAEEIKSLKAYDTSFKIAIGLMAAVSLIPFGVDVYQLVVQKVDLLQVLKNTPSLMFAILPLYFPVMWFAYSSSKKLNLSKRLIEEYTHKAVLGGTFSGLSNQIESLPRDNAVKDELRTRLLFNLLQVSSENPGKLITDYNKSDHPFMDALENSAKLSDSIQALAKLPGFSAIAKKLSDRADEMLSNETKKVEHGLATQEELEKPTVVPGVA